MDNRFEGKWQYRRLLLLTSRPPNINDVRSRRTSVPVRGLYQENRICVIAPSYTAPETPPRGIIAVYHQLIGISRIIFVEAEKRGLFFTVDLVSIMVVAPRWLQGICKLILILCLTNLHGECPSVHPSKHAEPMLKLLLAQSRGRWANIKSTLVQCLVFAGTALQRKKSVSAHL